MAQGHQKLPLKELLKFLEEQYAECEEITEIRQRLRILDLINGRRQKSIWKRNNWKTARYDRQRPNNWVNRQHRNAAPFKRCDSHINKWRRNQYQNHHKWFNPPTNRGMSIYTNSRRFGNRNPSNNGFNSQNENGNNWNYQGNQNWNHNINNQNYQLSRNNYYEFNRDSPNEPQENIYNQPKN